ncbi:hypothetical protein LTR85_002756 [Meristemomyces frigidus]|nr:hypothetical protein LTR85_002756 [Meristemomyces frigidus]
MADKLIVLVTGANQGIGLYAAQQFAATGKHHVFVGSRDLAKGEKAVATLVAEGVDKESLEAVQLDVTSDESIEAAAKIVLEKYGRLDILANNAGISSAPGTKRAELQQIYDTNVFGAVIATDAFLPLLRKSTLPGGKRIVFVSSSLGSLTFASDLKGQFPGKLFLQYRSSKTALNMVLVSYASMLDDEEGFVVSGLCPGYCTTNLTNYDGYKDPRDGAKVILMAAEGEKKDVHCKVVHEGGAYPW